MLHDVTALIAHTNVKNCILSSSFIGPINLFLTSSILSIRLLLTMVLVIMFNRQVSFPMENNSLRCLCFVLYLASFPLVLHLHGLASSG